MPISIKNPETDELARKLVQLTGETITDAIRIALEQRYQRVLAGHGRDKAAYLKAIASRCAAFPDLSRLSDDEILGYDEYGVPAR